MKDLDEREDREARAAQLKGLGCSRKRVEDARFTQGKGHYVDDIRMPGMLHGDFVRSPYAHARVVSIDASAALALPGVVAVLTAKDLEPLSLHWMPTLAGDKQMVLADGKVLFQGQEVAFVVAKDRYIAADAVELVEVEYEDLPVIVDPFEALKSDVVLREDLAGQTEVAHGARKHHNHIFTWEAGDAEATEQVLDEAEVGELDVLKLGVPELVMKKLEVLELKVLDLEVLELDMQELDVLEIEVFLRHQGKASRQGRTKGKGEGTAKGDQSQAKPLCYWYQTEWNGGYVCHKANQCTFEERRIEGTFDQVP